MRRQTKETLIFVLAIMAVLVAVLGCLFAQAWVVSLGWNLVK